MESLTSGTLAGTGSFRCEDCGHIVTLAATEQLTSCPSCGGRSFARASLFAAGRFPRRPEDPADDRAAIAEAARVELADAQPGPHLAFRDGDALRIVALDREWMRVGRSLAAELRFDDATVSRRHARIAQEGDEVRVLDDRSLNGVFVNGERVDARVLKDGDELVVGRHRLLFVDTRVPGPDAPAPSGMRTIAD
jgi:predicted  nucleic acid-binding Zn-ribbon protein